MWQEEWEMHNNTADHHLEVGANIGACVMEMLAHTNAKIVAFEPNPANINRMTNTLHRLGPAYSSRVTLYPFGLGSQNTVFQLHAQVGNFGNGVFVAKVLDPGKIELQPPVAVNVYRLDDLLPHSPAFRTVKLDIQGYECKFLAGASHVLGEPAQGRSLKTEFAAKWLKAQSCDLYASLAKLGYKMVPAVSPPLHSNINRDIMAHKQIV
jgi:FkbM family methyltransferase